MKNFKNLFYRHGTLNDTVYVNISNGIWLETYKDSSFSKCELKWTSDTTFELKFVESNHLAKSNLSKKGDMYYYKLLSKEKGFYYVMAEVPGRNIYHRFKIYKID